MKQYNYIFWDFDGTLVNTIKGTREAATYALSKFGIEEHNEDLGKIFCGPPLKESFKKFGLCDEQIKVSYFIMTYIWKNMFFFHYTYIQRNNCFCLFFS